MVDPPAGFDYVSEANPNTHIKLLWVIIWVISCHLSVQTPIYSKFGHIWYLSCPYEIWCFIVLLLCKQHIFNLSTVL